MKILIACVGNIFLGDDGFGVEVARRMAFHKLPSEVVVKDFGIRGFDLAYALMESPDLTILVDACSRGLEPGTVFVLEPDRIDNANRGLELHGMNPMNVLRLVKSLGGTPGRVLIVGCEPAELGSENDGQLDLSDRVHAAVDQAIALIESLVSKTLCAKAQITLDGEPATI
jgi:hydrogenase maturation protease